jgi:hypothetical protein
MNCKLLTDRQLEEQTDDITQGSGGAIENPGTQTRFDFLLQYEYPHLIEKTRDR